MVAALCVAVVPLRANDLPTLQIVAGDVTHRIAVEVVDTPQARQRGLMFRQSMPDNQGMLFDFEREGPVSMWMRNTYISLDMLFAGADGIIHTIARRTQPFSEKVIPGSKPTRYVLEINGGMARTLGIERGDRIIIPED